MLDMGEREFLNASDASTPKETPQVLVDGTEKLVEYAGDLINNSLGVPKIRKLTFDLEMAKVRNGNSWYKHRTCIHMCIMLLTTDTVGINTEGTVLGPRLSSAFFLAQCLVTK